MLSIFYRITFIALIALAAQPQARADFATLQKITADGNESAKSQVYAAYMAREDVDSEIIKQILEEVKDWYEVYKYRVYIAYMANPHARQDQLIMIVDDTLKMTSPKFLIFKNYLMGAFANREHIEGVLNRIENFDEPGEAVFYLAYLTAKLSYEEDYTKIKNDVIESIEEPAHLKG